MSVDNSFTRNEPLWRDRNRALSLENCRDCDAIFRQFFNISLVLPVNLNEASDSEQLLANRLSVNMEPVEL